MPRPTPITHQVRPVSVYICSLCGQGPHDGLRLILLQLAMVESGEEVPMLGLRLEDAVKLRDILSLAIIEEQGKLFPAPRAEGT